MRVDDPRRFARLGVIVVLALAGVGCSVRPTGPTLVAVDRVTVLPPSDAAGHPLASGDGNTEGLGEVLASAASAALAQNGFTVVSSGTVPAAPGGATLSIRLDRWVPVPEQTMRIDAVLVELDVTLANAQDQRVLWHTHRPLQPVRVYGSLMVGQAYEVAANAVMAEVLAPLRPTR